MNKFGKEVLTEALFNTEADYTQSVDYFTKGDSGLSAQVLASHFTLEHEGHFAIFTGNGPQSSGLVLAGRKSKDFTTAALLQVFQHFPNVRRIATQVETFGNPQYLPPEMRPIVSTHVRTLIDGREVFSVVYVIDRPEQTSTQVEALDEEDEEALVDDIYNELDEEDAPAPFRAEPALISLPVAPTQEQTAALKGVENAVNEKIQVPAGIKGLKQGLTLQRG